jgi:ribosomal protein S18 acetylase RimI-like enzyme
LTLPGSPGKNRGVTSIRLATDRDAATLAEFAERTFRAAFASANTAADMDEHCRRSYGEAIQAAEIRDPARATLLGFADERLVGYGQLRWGAPASCVVAARPAEIQRLYVDASQHGKGVAHSLMAALLDRAIAGGADVAWLGVWERNPRAMAFYAKSGFEVVGEHVFVVGADPQRDLVLVKRLARVN